MLLLFETPAGYGIFKISNKKKLESVEDIASMFKEDSLSDNISYQCFKKFKDTENAVNSINSIQNGELPDDLRKFLKKNIVSKNIKERLLCKTIFFINHIYIFNFIGYDSNIANLIKNRLEIETECNSKYLEVFRGIRSQLTNLLDGNSCSKIKSIKYSWVYFLDF